MAWRLAQCLLQRGQVREALALCRDAAAGLGEGEDVLRAQLAAVQSAAHLMLSEFAAAVTMAQAACSIADRIEVITPGIAAGSTGFALWERVAQRIAAAASAALAGTGPPDPRRYAALIYVDRPIPANG